MFFFLFRLFLCIGIFFFSIPVISGAIDKIFKVDESIDVDEVIPNQVKKRGLKIINITSIILLPIFLLIGISFKWCLVFFITLHLTFYSVLIWIYARETRQYISVIFFILFDSIIILNIGDIFVFIFEGELR